MKIKSTWTRNSYVLRNFNAGEGEKYFQDCLEKLDEELVRLTGTQNEFSRERVLNYYEHAVEANDRYDFILVAPSGKFIGEAVINEIDWQLKKVNFRIAIFERGERSKGLGTWMVEKIRDFVFEKLKLQTLELTVLPFNERAQHVYKKAGFKVDKKIKNETSGADEILMSISEKSWKNLIQKIIQ